MAAYDSPDAKRKRPGVFRKFPKKLAAPGTDTKYVTDWDALKRLYLDNPHYSFRKFLETYGFNPKQVEYLPKSWQADWIEKQSSDQDEEIKGDVVHARRRILQERTRHIEAWPEMAVGLRELFRGHIALQLEAQQHDYQNKAAIEGGQVKRRYKATAMDMAFMMNAAKRLLEVERQALLVPQKEEPKHLLPAVSIDQKERMRRRRIEEFRNTHHPMMGIPDGSEIPREKMTELFSKYLDNFKPGQDEEEFVDSVIDAAENPDSENKTFVGVEIETENDE